MPLVQTVLLAALALGVGAAGAGPPKASEVAAGLGFAPDSSSLVSVGAIATRNLPGEGALSAAVVIAADVDAVFAALRGGEILEIDRATRASGEIDPARVAASLAGLGLEGPDLERVAARAQAYLAGGVAALEPYPREGGEARPAEALARAAEAEKGLAARTPLYRSFADFPRDGAAALDSRLRWEIQEDGDRSAAAVIHRMSGTRDGTALLVDRQIYLSEGPDARQIVAACLPVEEGTLVYWSRRSSSAADRGPRDAIVEFLQSLRDSFEPD